jgi:hypothetical protein
MATTFTQDLHEFTKAEENVLSSRLNAIRASISHPGEKDESVEMEIMQFIRGFLPSEYGVGTGFIAYHAKQSVEETSIVENGETSYKYSYFAERDVLKLSSQLDIIIYDAMRSGPIVQLGTCEVFPLEGVYGYIEVKSSIGKRKDKQGKTAIQRLLDQSNELRSMKTRLYWRPLKGTYTRAVAFPFPLRESISIRSYAVILDAEALGSKKDIHALMQDDFRIHDGDETFMHGIYVNGKGFYRFNPMEEYLRKDKRTISFYEQAPLSEFKKALYMDLCRFPRTPDGCTIAIDKYFDQTADGVVSSILIEENGKKIIRVG